MVDQYMTHSLELLLICLAEVLGIFVLICVVFPWFIIAFVPILGIYFWIQAFFRKTSRGERTRADSMAL